MPAASFIAKAAREFATVAGGVFPHLNDLFNKENEFADNGDELFREFVVADFLFRFYMFLLIFYKKFFI